MKARTKSAGLLFATLVVGILIGAFGASALQNRRAEQIRSTFEERGRITDMFVEVIQPADEAQRVQIRAVLEKAEARFREGRRECRNLFAADRDSMRADLNALLTPDQQTRLDEWLSRDRRSRNGHRGRGGPDGRRDRDARNGDHRPQP